VHIAITRMSGDTNPDIVNINPPLSPASLEGPAQYRYTSGIEVAATLPVSTATDVYFKVANFHYSGPGSLHKSKSDHLEVGKHRSQSDPTDSV